VTTTEGRLQTRCRSCGAAIIWAITANGKRMPVDAQPLRGLLQLHDRPDDEAPLVRVLPIEVHRSHFATCPQADQHRRPS
jgi:hypothetical protein